MNSVPSRGNFKAVTVTAVACRSCFADLPVKSALINIAQPRWVGPSYWASKPRVAIVMLNPGSGETRGDSKHEDSPEKRSLRLLQSFASGEGSLSAVFEHQAHDMPNWGNGRFVSFYLTGLSLQQKDLAFANVAWCATSGNKHPSAMLKRCFVLHTAKLLRALAPNLILLSGSGTHRFARGIQSFVPGARVISMFHYAHRKGADAEATELARVRQLIAKSRKAVT